MFEELNNKPILRFNGTYDEVALAGAVVEPYEMSLRETVMSSIADPNIGFVLLIAGALGLYIEFNAPGLIVPGVAGGILLLLGLSSLSVLPISWVGVSLLILGLVLFGLEAHFTSGILGVGGAVSMVLGAVLLVNGPPSLQIHLSTALAVVIPFAMITIFLLTIVMKAQVNKAITGMKGMLGEVGEARTELSPVGKIFIHGEYWNAESSVPVSPGTKVRVVSSEGLTLHVEPINTGTS